MSWPFSTEIDRSGNIILKKNFDIIVLNSRLNKARSYLQSGVRIGKSYFKPEKPLKGNGQEIITQIHKLRFDPVINPYVITGGHFPQLFVRNLGVFYNALLDPRTPLSLEDWTNRQRIVLQTIALDLEFLHKAKTLATTITPLSKNIFLGINIYAYPSDTLFSILFALCALNDQKFIVNTFPFKNRTTSSYDLKTQKVTKELLKTYRQTLETLLKQYKKTVFDEREGLIKKSLYLSGARDGIKRSSSFYDNVICWATFYLADKLGIVDSDNHDMRSWKDRIINTFWNEKEGVFIDDLSSNLQKQNIFSADSLIVSSSGFFDQNDKKDREKMFRIIQFIQKNSLDKPLPLRYSSQHNRNKLYPEVRFFAPDYMTKSIWSHWGIEYIKWLLWLSDKDSNFLKRAENYLTKYRKNIELYGGYPETYDPSGKPLATGLYRSVLHNGWVVNYEQVKSLSESFIKVSTS